MDKIKTKTSSIEAARTLPPGQTEMILAYRQKTGCKQYVFADLPEAFNYFRKKCYFNEMLKFYEYDDTSNREIRRFYHHNIWTD